jgi:hypothetical protein
MTRAPTITGIWLTALSLGILGYQALTWIFYDSWPAVTVAFVWSAVFEPWPADSGGWSGAVAAWFGHLPLLAVGIAFAYLVFLVADSLPQPSGASRPPRGN